MADSTSFDPGSSSSTTTDSSSVDALSGLGGTDLSQPLTGVGSSAISGLTDSTAPSINTGGTPVSADTTGTSSGVLGSLGNILGAGYNWLTSPSGSAATSTALGLYEAQQQKAQNAALAGQLTNVSTPVISGGLSDLSNYQNLTPLQQQALTSGVSTGQTLTGEAAPLIGIGQTGFNQYQQGQLQPWQQAQLNQQVASQKATARQALGANVDSTTLAQVDAQIDQQAAITQGQLMSQNLSTAEQAYSQGTGLQQQGGTMATAAYNTAVSDVNTNLSNALSEIGAGLGPLESAIQLQIAGNTQISAALMNMFGAIAKAAAGTGTTTGTTGAAAGGAGGGLLGSIVGAGKTIYNALTGGPAADTGVDGLNAVANAASTDPAAAASYLSAISGIPSAAGGAAAAPGASIVAEELGATGAEAAGGFGAGGALGADALATMSEPVAGVGDAAIAGLTSAAPSIDVGAGAAASDIGLGAGLGVLGAAAVPFVLGPMLESKAPPAGNPLTGGYIQPGDPGYAAISAFEAPNTWANTQSMQGFSSPDAALAAWQQGMAGQSTYQGPQQESYQQLVQQYIAQGGDPSKILPQYQQYIPVG